jgi:stage III sporulation protein AD
MEIVAKCAGTALLSTVVCILIKRINPELSFAAAAVMLLGTVGLIQSLTGLAERARDAMGVSGTLLQPMLKCAGIAAISKLCAELCKDASQGAIAAAVEIAATLCATAVAMPVIMNMLNMIGGMV